MNKVYASRHMVGTKTLVMASTCDGDGSLGKHMLFVKDFEYATR